MIATFKKGSFWPEFTEIPSQSLICLYCISVLWNLKKSASLDTWGMWLFVSPPQILFTIPATMMLSSLTKLLFQSSQRFSSNDQMKQLFNGGMWTPVPNWVCWWAKLGIWVFVLQQFVAWQLVVLESLIKVSWLQILWSTVRGLTVVATHSTWFKI